jgi:hypothetical protein
LPGSTVTKSFVGFWHDPTPIDQKNLQQPRKRASWRENASKHLYGAPCSIYSLPQAKSYGGRYKRPLLCLREKATSVVNVLPIIPPSPLNLLNHRRSLDIR